MASRSSVPTEITGHGTTACTPVIFAVLFRDVDIRVSQLEQESEHLSDLEEGRGPNSPESIDGLPIRDRLQILTPGIARMIETCEPFRVHRSLWRPAMDRLFRVS